MHDRVLLDKLTLILCTWTGADLKLATYSGQTSSLFGCSHPPYVVPSGKKVMDHFHRTHAKAAKHGNDNSAMSNW